MVSTASESYTKTAIALHWIIGGAIILMIAFGFFMEDMPQDMKPLIYQTHKSIGLTILVLSFVRLAWRLAHKAPAFPTTMKPWEVVLARIIHGVFYVMMIGIPLSGWALVSSAPAPYDFPIQWFGLFEWPALPLGRSGESAEFFSETHEILAIGTLALLALHVGGAMKHHIIDKDPTILSRMIPCCKK